MQLFPRVSERRIARLTTSIPDGWRAIIPVIFLASLGIALAISVRGGPLPVDEEGMDMAQSVQGVGDIAWFFNVFLNQIGIPVLWVVTIAMHTWMRSWRVAGFFAAAALISPFTSVLKAIVDRPRPSGSFSVVEFPADASFPSGHTTWAIGLFGSWFLLAPHIMPARFVLPVRVACVAAILLTAFSRLWVGAHWPTDVTASMLFGFAFLIALSLCFRIRVNPSAS